MPTKAIRPQLVGHMWNSTEPTLPRIISAVRSVCWAGYVGGGGSVKWLVDYTLTPCGRYKVKGGTKSWKEREAFVAHLYPAGSHKWEDTSGAGVSHTRSIFITFVGGECADLLPLVHAHSYARFMDPSRRLGQLMERILQIGLDLGDGGFWDAQAVLCEIIALLRRSPHVEEETYVVPETEDPPQSSEFVQSIRLYFQEHLVERITREDLAKHLHTSVSALAHRYRAETGEPPMATLARMRMNLIKSLLFRGYGLKAIADQTGFCDEFHLSKMFKRHEGVSPQEFRRRQSSEQ